MAKPVGAACNLACHYCYYQKPGRSRMSMATLEEYIKQYLAMQTTGHALFTWHGGEPMLRPLDFYRTALSLQRKHAPAGMHIENCIQTNGTLLTPEWCEFLHANQWLVGISIDGTEQMHDAYRGQGTWRRVMNGIRLLQRHQVEWNAMATVHQANASRPLEFYRFFKEISCNFLQFTPIVERNTRTPLPMAVGPDEWGEFLCSLFDEWVTSDVGRVFVQIFDATLANWVGVTPGLCTLSAECGHAGIIEANGDVYSCDHFVFPEHRLGNIHSDTLINMMYGPQQSRFSALKSHLLPDQCRQCRWLFACHGECPKNRFAHTPDGQPGLNWLCQGYRHFFSHVAPQMDIMATLYRQGRAPAEIMKSR